jgi:hypothetical protein
MPANAKWIKRGIVLRPSQEFTATIRAINGEKTEEKAAEGVEVRFVKNGRKQWVSSLLVFTGSSSS